LSTEIILTIDTATSTAIFSEIISDRNWVGIFQLFKLPGRYRGYTDEIDIRKDLMKMWRSLFLAIGFFIGLIGFECLFIEAAIFTQSSEVVAPDFHSLSTQIPITISPPDWAPWVCMACGTIVMIYSFTIPRRVRG